MTVLEFARDFQFREMEKQTAQIASVSHQVSSNKNHPSFNLIVRLGSIPSLTMRLLTAVTVVQEREYAG